MGFHSTRITLGIWAHSNRHLGRADTEQETAFQTARREASEEIGLPDTDTNLPPPFRVEHLCELPANLAKTELVVRPCVALLHGYDPHSGLNADPESLIPTLDAREVAAVFTAPLIGFLKSHLGPDEWYRGSWSLWHNENWKSELNSICSMFMFMSMSVSFVFVVFYFGLSFHIDSSLSPRWSTGKFTHGIVADFKVLCVYFHFILFCEAPSSRVETDNATSAPVLCSHQFPSKSHLRNDGANHCRCGPGRLCTGTGV